VPEWGPLGSVRGALSNERPYRNLRNVVTNYPFESSRGFPGSKPNSGHGDHSRLSCSAGAQLGAGFCRDLHGRWPSCGVAEKARIGTIASRQGYDVRMIGGREVIWHHGQATVRLACLRGNNRVEFGFVANRC
jgi:hypothetical protein